MIAAAVLTKEEVVLEGCPKISDVEDMAEIVRSLGGTVWWERNALHLNCGKIEKSRVEGALSKRLRASLLFLGSLLARTGEAYLAGAGGCRIGKRPTDLHQRAMELLGAEVFEEDGTIRAKADHPKGAVLCFPKKSVGATENAVLFAVGAEGATRLEHCAREPEVVHLCRFLKAMGAEITGEGTEQITVYGRQGKRLLSGCRYRVPGDRIAAGTYLLMGAATRGHLTLSGAPLDEMGAVLSLYQKIGGQYYRKSGTLKINGREACRPVPFVQTEIYHGFPTDLQAPLMAVLTGNPGESVIQEQIFEDRFGSACQMRKMGAHIEITGNRARITGGFPLRGTEVEAGDLRGGAALVLAALMAEGETCIRGAELIGRGYEHICEDLKALGCRIWQSGTRKKEYE